MARIEAGQENRLIADEAGRTIDRARIAAAGLEVGLGARDEEASGIIEARQTLEVEIAAIHDIEGAGFGKELIQNIDVVHLAVTDENERGNIAAQIKQRMELHGGLGGSKRRPREHREAEIDGGGIQRIDGLVEFKRQWIVGIEPPRDADEVLGEVGVDAPVAHGVGVRQGVAGNRAAETQMVELEGLRAKTRFDVAQALAPGQLREGKTKILIEA